MKDNDGMIAVILTETDSEVVKHACRRNMRGTKCAYSDARSYLGTAPGCHEGVSLHPATIYSPTKPFRLNPW